MKIAAVRILYYIKYTEISPIRLYKRNENEKKMQKLNIKFVKFNRNTS